MAAFSSSAAGAINGEWKAPPTGRRSARRAPASLSATQAASTASISPEIIRENLLKQLTAPVRWTQSVQNMIADGANEFYEFGPGDVLKGMIRKINPDVQVG